MRPYTVKQASALLGVTTVTIFEWINAGKLDAIRFESAARVEGAKRGSRTFVLQSEIDRVIAARTQPSAQPKPPAIRIVISRTTGAVISELAADQEAP